MANKFFNWIPTKEVRDQYAKLFKLNALILVFFTISAFFLFRSDGDNAVDQLFGIGACRT